MKEKQFRKKHNWQLIIGCGLTGFFVLFTIIGQFWTPYDVTAMDAAARSAPPSLAHIMGTDNFGRDVFSRVMNGCGNTFLVAFCTVGIGAVFGTAIGALTGFYGGWIDEIIMRINDAILSFPSILLALILISLLGPGKLNIIIALGIIFIPSFAVLSGRSAAVQIFGICAERPCDGHFKFQDYFHPYFAEHMGEHADRGNDRIQQCSALGSKHELFKSGRAAA